MLVSSFATTSSLVSSLSNSLPKREEPPVVDLIDLTIVKKEPNDDVTDKPEKKAKKTKK